MVNDPAKNPPRAPITLTNGLLGGITVLTLVIVYQVCFAPAQCVQCPPSVAESDTVVVAPGDTVVLVGGDSVVVSPGDSVMVVGGDLMLRDSVIVVGGDSPSVLRRHRTQSP